jgi:hypothetical protein
MHEATIAGSERIGHPTLGGIAIRISSRIEIKALGYRQRLAYVDASPLWVHRSRTQWTVADPKSGVHFRSRPGTIPGVAGANGCLILPDGSSSCPWKSGSKPGARRMGIPPMVQWIRKCIMRAALDSSLQRAGGILQGSEDAREARGPSRRSARTNSAADKPIRFAVRLRWRSQSKGERKDSGGRNCENG